MEVNYLTVSYEQGVAPPRLFLSEILNILNPFHLMHAIFLCSGQRTRCRSSRLRSGFRQEFVLSYYLTSPPVTTGIVSLMLYI